MYKINAALIILSIYIHDVILTFRNFGSPEGQVITKQLHNQSGILISFLGDGVDFAQGIVEGSFGQIAGFFGGIEDFEEEDGIVEG